jgi:MoaA/NifB/PqqE/SkfB family radical SAM enzyme
MTTRAMIDVGRKCNAKCPFCYYHHLGDLSKQEYKSVDELTLDIVSAKKRGCDYIDFSGGEPMLHPDIANLIAIVNKNGMRCCVITNATCGETILLKCIDYGVDDFLISMHGFSETHDKIMGIKNARDRQINFIDVLNANKISFRVNYVMSSINQNDIVSFSDFIASTIKPRIVNFINFNPHGQWGCDTVKSQKIISDLFIVENQLNAAIPILEAKGIGVNVRYYPMCRINPEYYRCICNDMHVMYDPYEWDNGVPHTEDDYKKWAISTSKSVEWKDIPCRDCTLLSACGGINRAVNCHTFGQYPEAIRGGSIHHWYQYRAQNILTLTKRGAHGL